MLESVLIANRGEIAVRIVRACRELGVRSIAVYSEADAGALHVRLADEAHCLGPGPARESYLNIDKVVAAALDTGAQAVHPGYGLLSENADFAAAVLDAGLIFIGPTPQLIATMGDKVAARAAAARCEVPLPPGSDGPIADADAALALADEIGFPLVVKACFGGGGRGMRVVRDAGGMAAALAEAGRESTAAFGRAEVYLERYVEHARHVEVQVLGDAHGNVVHLGDRDCSVQRRHQKLIEEAPAPALAESLRLEIAAAAVRLARSVDYVSAGTVEFLVDVDAERFYFLEMNTRLQVEHGVTELVTGVDLVAAQLRIAVGEALGFDQEDVVPNGHAIQARIAAEDPWESFRPDPGTVADLRLPLGPWLRLDFGIESGDTIPGHYDSMFGKVQAWGPDRETARRRLACALQTLVVSGVATTAPYLAQVLEQPAFVQAGHDTGSVERDWAPAPATRPASVAAVAPPATAPEAISERRVTLQTGHGAIEVAVYGTAREARAEQAASGRTRGGSAAASRAASEPVAPMDGTVVQIVARIGQEVDKGEPLVVLEAMKMELVVSAPRAGVVGGVLVRPGDIVSRGALLVELNEPDAG